MEIEFTLLVVDLCRYLKRVIMEDMEREGEVRKVAASFASLAPDDPAVRALKPPISKGRHQHANRREVAFFWKLVDQVPRAPSPPAAVESTEKESTGIPDLFMFIPSISDIRVLEHNSTDAT